MTLYAVLKEFTKLSHSGRITFLDEGIDKLENELDVYIYRLLNNITNIRVTITISNIEYSLGTIGSGGHLYGLQDVSEDDYSILQTLDLSQLPNYIRCKIADFLWVQKSCYSAAKVAAKSYLELYEETVSEEYWYDGICMLYRSISISLLINCQIIKEKARQTICNSLRNDVYHENVYAIIKLIEILVEQKLQDDNIILPVLDKILDDACLQSQTIEEVYDLKLQYLKLKKASASEFKSVKLALAQRYEEEAEKYGTMTFRDISIAVDLLIKASNLYRNNNESAEARRVQKRAIKLQNKLPQLMYSKVKEYDVSNLHNYLLGCFEGLSFTESIIRVTQLTIFRSIDEVKSCLIERRWKYPFVSSASSYFINEKGQIVYQLSPLDMRNPEADMELLNAHIHKELHDFEETHGALFLEMALNILRDHYDFSSDDIDFLICDNAIIPKGRESIFKSAIYMALQRNYFEALHILAPQMENLFRNLAEELGASTANYQDNGTSQAITLKAVFELPELIDAYDSDILFTFQGLLCERFGANIRNEIAHGLLSQKTAYSGVSIYFICAVMKLLTYTSPESKKIYMNSDKLKNLEEPQTDISPVPINNGFN